MGLPPLLVPLLVELLLVAPPAPDPLLLLLLLPLPVPVPELPVASGRSPPQATMRESVETKAKLRSMTTF